MLAWNYFKEVQLNWYTIFFDVTRILLWIFHFAGAEVQYPSLPFTTTASATSEQHL